MKEDIKWRRAADLNGYRYPPEVIVPIKTKHELKLFAKNKRFKVFYKRGIICPTCGRKATSLRKHYQKKSSIKGKIAHWDLFCADGVMMTVDHILPKAKGGKNGLYNLQTMCRICNVKKGDTVEVNHENNYINRAVANTHLPSSGFNDYSFKRKGLSYYIHRIIRFAKNF